MKPIASAIFLLIFCLFSCNTKVSPKKNRAIQEDGTIVPNLYVYTLEDISNFIKKYSSFNVNSYIQLRKNSYGTALYFCMVYKNDVLMVSKDTEVKKLVSPAAYSVLNDKGEFVIWTDDLRKEIRFNNGYVLQSSDISKFDVDPSGQYYFTETKLGQTKIYNINNPNVLLAQVEFSGLKMFFYDDVIYLFGFDRIYYKEHDNRREIICNTFKKTGSTLELENQIYISRPKEGPSPFTILDMDPVTKNILILDSRDEPFSSIFYLYNLHSKTMKQIYMPKDFEYAGFLKEDFLQIHQ